MKRSALIIFTCCLVQLSVSAQSSWLLGFRAGASIAYNNLSIDIAEDQIVSRYNLGGLLLSIPVEYQHSEMFSIVSGVTYLQKGTSIEVRGMTASRTYINTFVLDYIQVPVRGKLALRLNRLQLYLSAGLSAAYATDLKRITSIGAETPETSKLDFQASSVRRFDLNLLGGAGIQVDVPRGKRLFVESLFNAGVLDIDQTPERQVYNQGYIITLGIMVGLNKRKNVE